MKALPLLGIVGDSGTGKTTLLRQLIPQLTQLTFNVALIKHTHHNVDVDTPGKDSHTLRKAGALQTIVTCDEQWALMTETPNTPATLWTLAQQFDRADIILVEGFKHEPIPHILLHRDAHAAFSPEAVSQYTIAIASDQRLQRSQPVLDINDPQQIAYFILDYFQHKRASLDR